MKEVIVVTERERLIELLQSVPVDCTDCRGVGTIADYLLENGVIVPPVKVGDTLTVTARATATGKRITQLTGEAYIKETGRLAATAASVYMNVDTVKEREQNKK